MVQGIFEVVLVCIVGFDVQFVVVGCMDVGVYVSGQVVYVDFDERQWLWIEVRYGCVLQDLVGMIVGCLCGVFGVYFDVIVFCLLIVFDGFDVWFLVVWWCYCYCLVDEEFGYDLLCWFDMISICGCLDDVVMDVVVCMFIGLYDFVVYCKLCLEVMMICMLFDYCWVCDVDGVFVVEVKVDVFCYSMVCVFVGVCVVVGEGCFDVDDFVVLWDVLMWMSEFKVLLVWGLIFIEVGYLIDDLLLV